MTQLQIAEANALSTQKSLKAFLTSLKTAEGEFKQDMSAEEETRLTELRTAHENAKKQFEQVKSLNDLDGQLVPAPVSTSKALQLDGETIEETKNVKAFSIPASARFSRVKNFQANDAYSADEQAYRFGMWTLAVLGGSRKAYKWCEEHGVKMEVVDGAGHVKAMSEIVNTAGGALVPDEFATTLIDLKEQYGVFRRFSGLEPMTSDTKFIPRRTGGATVYFVGEGTAPTASDLAFDNISLVAKKMAAITVYSSELNEDAVINIGDRIIGEIAYALANKEDECGFNGDGTATYGGITGVREKIKGLSGTIANIAGLQVGTGNAYSELALVDFEGVVALLPQYADTPNARWFCHRTFYYNVMLKLALAAGGVTKEEIVNGQRTPMFLGYPVAVSQVMPKAEANSQVCALLGDLALASKFGERRQQTVQLSNEYKFAEDQLAIKVTQRIDINVHDVGNADATAANRVPGPIVGLITAAS